MSHSVKLNNIDLTVNSIVNNKPEYPVEFISRINRDTGVLKSAIKDVCSSLHNAENAPVIRNIAGVLSLAALTHIEDGKNDFRSRIVGPHAYSVKKVFKILLEEMDTELMPLLDCGKKKYNKYSYGSKRRLKCVVLHAVAYHMAKNSIGNA